MDILTVQKNMVEINHFLCVTSVINIGTNPLSYTSTRSIFNHEQRFQQTCKTLQTLKEKIEHSFILLVDASPIPLTETQIQMLKNVGATDVYCFRHEDCEGPYKGLGEVRILKASLEYMTKNNIDAKWWWKIGGRA